jgi:hypothetical protein
MKLYIGVMMADIDVKGFIATEKYPIAFVAGTDEFAHASTHLICMKKFPPDAGYYNHTENIVEVEDQEARHIAQFILDLTEP